MSNNSNFLLPFLVHARKHRKDNCIDGAVRRPESKIMDGAMTDIQNLGYVELASWPLLLVQTQNLVTPQSHRKCIVRDTH
jgi:hypothetical protein